VIARVDLPHFLDMLAHAGRHAAKDILPSIEVPTLIIWGDRDPYALPELAEASARLCREARVVHVPEATHWVQHEQPERVTALLIDFLSNPRQA